MRFRLGENLNPEKVGFHFELSGRFQVGNEQVDHIFSFPTNYSILSVLILSLHNICSTICLALITTWLSVPQEHIKFPQNISRVNEPLKNTSNVRQCRRFWQWLASRLV